MNLKSYITLIQAVVGVMFKLKLSINTTHENSTMLTVDYQWLGELLTTRTHHLHGRVNEWHSNVWRSEIHIIARAKRHPIPRVTGLHQAAEAGQNRKTPIYLQWASVHTQWTEMNETEWINAERYLGSLGMGGMKDPVRL